MLRAGERIGPLRIERALGIGGMGEVYLARDERLERHVAVKLLPTGRRPDPHARGRMLREARAASALKHPNIVTIHDIGEHDGRAYIVMEYIDGETFAAMIDRRGPLPPVEAVALFAQAADAVAAAHAAGVLHRDIKSANLMIDRGGQVKVLDFGLSKRTETGTPTPVPGSLAPVDTEAPTLAPDSDEIGVDVGVAPTATPISNGPTPTPSLSSSRTDEPPHTAHGARMGTPGWAPPELIDGRPADVRSDVFSLGCVLYHLLAGKPAFTGTSWRALREMIDRGPPPPSQHARGVPIALDQVVLGALATDPARRPQGPTALIAAARDALPRRRPGRAIVWTASALAVVGIAAGAALVIADTPSPRAPAAVASASPPSAPVQLTNLGGCAYSPTFLDEETVIFDLTRDNLVDLFRIDLGTGEPVRLTTDPGWEWRSARGASDHVVAFIRQGDAGAGVDTLDLATGARATVAGEAGPVAYARDAYFYAPSDGGKLRRVRGGRDDVFVDLPPGRNVDTLVASPDGERLAMVLLAETILPEMCIVELDAPAVVCHPDRVSSSRPAFSSDGTRLYHEHEGIRRLVLATGDVEPVLPGLGANGGLAVSPSGRSLIYSTCGSRSLLISLLDDPATPVVDEPTATQPAFGPGGLLAYVRFDRPMQTVVLREPGGTSREVVSGTSVHFSDLAFSADGLRFAFVFGDPDAPGIGVASVTSTALPNRVTEDATDTGPVFIGDEIVFTRRASNGTPQLMRVRLDGSGAMIASPRPRLTVGVDAAHGRVLLAAPGKDFLYWWDPVTGLETPGPTLPPGGPPADLALSPDGRWLVVVDGPSGQSIWRVATTGKAAPEAVGTLRGDQSSLAGAIDDRGHPLVAVEVWTGELWLVTAGAGAPW